MYATVDEILHLDSFENVKLIAGKEGVNKVVKNVFFMEVPDISAYVEEYGLLLTTLYPIYSNEEAKENLITKLLDKNVTGLAIKPARYIDEIPEMMIQQANEYQFPLMILPPDANLSTIANEILEVLLDKNSNILKFRDFVHSKLMELLLKGADLKALINSLSTIVRKPVMLVDYNYDLICHSDELSGDIMIEKPKHYANFYATNHELTRKDLKITVGENDYQKKDYLMRPIKAGSEYFGYIIVLTTDIENENMVVAVEQTALLMASVFQKDKALKQIERNYLDSFVRDVLNNKYKTQYEAIQKAKVFKWDLQLPIIVMALESLNHSEDERRELYTYILNSRIIENLVSEKTGISKEKILTIYLDNAIVVFINVVFENDIKERMMTVARIIVDCLKSKGDFGIGISNTVEHISRFSTAFDEAKNSIKICKKLNEKNFVKHYDDLGIFEFLMEIKNKNAMEKYMYKKLGKVIEHDREFVLMDTLFHLIKNNFNLQKTANAMFVHYNTLRYRVEKLKELGINVENGLEMAEMALAFQINMLLGCQQEDRESAMKLS